MSREYRVLLVEDNLEQVELIHSFLQLRGDYLIDWVGDIQGLWKKFGDKDIDAVLMSSRLLDKTGLDALAEISGKRFHLPVIILTNQGEEEIAVRAIQYGAADYLVRKPGFLQTIPSMIQNSVKNHMLQQKILSCMDKIRYQALLLNQVREAVVVWSPSGKISIWNSAADKLFGEGSRRKVGGDVREQYFSLFSPPLTFDFSESFNGREEERQLVALDGTPGWVNSRITTLRDEENGGRILGFMDVCSDMTWQKKMEMEIHTAMTNLSETARLAAIGGLASGVAHRIFNPLTSIIANAQIIKHTLVEPSVYRESADDIEKAGWKAQEVVKQLLDFSMPHTGMNKELSVEQTIQNALGLIGSQIIANGVNLALNLHKDLPPISGNPRQIEDLWLNLLLLARDATSDGKQHTIRIQTEKHYGELMVEISDDGTPIPRDHLAHVFEPDFTWTDIGRGTGLELSICREIVRQHKGRINVESGLDGTRFRVYLPILAAQPLAAVTTGSQMWTK